MGNMRQNWNMTLRACYIGYITQAIVNNFAPLIFVWMMNNYGFSLGQIAFIPVLNFAIQLAVDLISAKYADKFGYRVYAIIAHLMSFFGMIALAFLPEILPPYAGVIIAVILMGIGGGIIEVLITPIVEACPTERKESAMQLLHSFYCWGQAGTVLISIIYFTFVGIEYWHTLICVFALIPVLNGYLFTYVPVGRTVPEEKQMNSSQLFSNKIFIMLMIMMICAGASELAMSQWSSAFAEEALHITKSAGDLAGPCAFALLMGTARALYGKYGENLPLLKGIILSALLCIVCYLFAALIPVSGLALLGCAVCGFSVGVFWPGTFSLAARFLPRGGTVMYALMALAGDIGGAAGPGLIGAVANAAGDNLRMGVLSGTIFPVVLLILAVVFMNSETKKSSV